ncbi:MAG: flagellin [Candidatus Gastranaerophilales bacterium]|nr:flagellin [Candidatus Gastranaerophilales bacterium]
MALVINTNVTSNMVQRNLNNANAGVNQSIERLSTGFKINKASDDAAGLSIAEGFKAQVSGSQIAKSNTEHGINLLQTAEGDMSVIQENLQRVRDLTVQAANGTYSTSERTMLLSEVKARFQEITRLANVSSFSEIPLLSNNGTNLTLQIGANTGADNRLAIGDALIKMTATALSAQFSGANLDTNFKTSVSASDFITTIDEAISKVTDARAKIGAYQNRLESALESLDIKYENLSSSLSQIRDADVAKESATLTKEQILQQASASLLSQANQNPSIALQLIG